MTGIRQPLGKRFGREKSRIRQREPVEVDIFAIRPVGERTMYEVVVTWVIRFNRLTKVQGRTTAASHHRVGW